MTIAFAALWLFVGIVASVFARRWTVKYSTHNTEELIAFAVLSLFGPLWMLFVLWLTSE
jgi:hypothetical protein